MTNFWKLIGTAAVAVSVLAACDDGTVTPAAPELGEITVSQEKIGVGHQVVLTVEDKTQMSGSLYSIDPVWTVNGSEIMDIYTDYEMIGGLGRYTCYYLASKAGKLEVALTVNMRFNNAPAGEDEKSTSVTADLEVVPCDARNSFWGDSVAITLYREPGLNEYETGNGVYVGIGNSSVTGIANYGIDKVNLTYAFEKGRLSRIEELFTLSAADGSYSKVAEIFDFVLRTLETNYAGGSPGGREVTYGTAVDASFISVGSNYDMGKLQEADKSILGQGLVQGLIVVEAAMSSGDTDITLTTDARPNSKSVDVILTYSSR